MNKEGSLLRYVVNLKIITIDKITIGDTIDISRLSKIIFQARLKQVYILLLKERKADMLVALSRRMFDSNNLTHKQV
jgi:hypothetical protein